MKKFLAMILLAMAPMLFVACDDEPNWGYGPEWPGGGGGQTDPFNQSLSNAEQDMVGSYVSADGKSPIVLVLNNDRGGFYVTTGSNGSKFSFKWALQSGKLYFKGTSASKNETYNATQSGGYLYLNNVPFVNPFKTALSSDEKKMVNYYVSDDGQTPFYMFLNDDRSGGFVINGATSSFTWFVRNGIFYAIISNTQVDMYKVSNANGRLCLTDGNGTVVPFKVYEQESQTPLVNQWQGSLNTAYYKDVYGLTGNGYATIYEFAADGGGAQLDYDVTSPQENFAYVHFSWVINGQTISISYSENESGRTSASFDDYLLTNDKFSGKMYLSGKGTYTFNYSKTSGFDWKPFLPIDKTTRSVQVGSMLRQLRGMNVKSISKGSFRK